ncbi:sensor histidine kinase [Actinokineospora enzanensis]|uniref:sensor histidine kinase n=1 Tax=Actinokineospora enzanensis TaxID=155975 RepID=UPI000374674D|nr:HAMP domain-containing sensor histidine kinase [Actinokineospora enzanensis]
MRKRIILLALAAAILATTLFGLPLALSIAKYYLHNERAELERVAARVAISRTTIPAEFQDDTIAWYSPSGIRTLGSGPPTADQAVQEATEHNEVTHHTTTTEMVVAVPAETGTVRVATPIGEVIRQTGLTWLAMTVLAALALTLSWLAARRMAARLAHPLETLTTAARSLGNGDFTVRTARTGIPEIDSVGASLDSTAHRLGETLDRERAFSANASHQLRTPLTGLRLQLESALQDPHTDPYDTIRACLETTDRLERTVDDLLTLARATPTAAETDLPTLLAETRTAWEAHHDRPLHITAHGAPDPHASSAAVRQILQVLLDNAQTHGTGAVTITARDAGETLAIDVADEGAFPDLDPFAPGDGIGLPLARRLAEAEGGRLVLASTTPTRFTLLLPTH